MDPPVNITINLFKEIIDPYKIELRCKHGELIPGKHWKVAAPTMIQLISMNLPRLEKDTNIWIGYYKNESQM